MENNFARYSNVVVTVPNYETSALQRRLEEYGKAGYKLVSTQMAKNIYGTEVMYLFFVREEKE